MARRAFGKFFAGSFGLATLNTVDSLQDGFFIGRSFVLADANAIFRSQNFVSGSTGFAVFGDGSAQFNNITLTGDFYGNWNGAVPVDLSAGPDVGATTGFAFDSSEGAAQFMGNLYVDRVRPAIVDAELDPLEGWLLWDILSSGVTKYASASLTTPIMNFTGNISYTFIDLLTERKGGTTPGANETPGFRFYTVARTFTDRPFFNLDASDGTSGPFRITWDSDFDTFITHDVTDQLNFWAGGVNLLNLIESTTDYIEALVPIDMSAQKIIDLANPTNAQDAATKAYVDASSGALTITGNRADEVLTVSAGKARRYLDGHGFTITRIRASVGVAPTGAAIIVDVNKNGTTVFTTQANRPTIAAAGFLSDSKVPNVTTLVAGDYLTLDVDQIGSTIAGGVLVVTIEGVRT